MEKKKGKENFQEMSCHCKGSSPSTLSPFEAIKQFFSSIEAIKLLSCALTSSKLKPIQLLAVLVWKRIQKFCFIWFLFSVEIV